MTYVRSQQFMALVMAMIATLACAQRSGAQSLNDLSAFSALIVTPAGALTPITYDNGQRQAEHTSLSLRYGGWSYDIDDARHDNVGVTYAHRVAGSRVSVAVTAAHLRISCVCAAWTSGGVAVTTTLWSSNSMRTTAARAVHVALDLTSGVARYAGLGHALAYASTAALDIGVGVATFKHTRMSIAVHPGVGYGRLQSVDAAGRGTRVMLGASASWRLPIGLTFDIGMQRIVLARGPTQYGGGLSWRSK